MLLQDPPPVSFFFFFSPLLVSGEETADRSFNWGSTFRQSMCFFGGVNRPILPEHQVLGLLHYTGGDVFTGENGGPVPEDSHQPTHTPPLPFQLIDSQKKMSLSSPNGTWVTFSEQLWEKEKVSPYSKTHVCSATRDKGRSIHSELNTHLKK